MDGDPAPTVPALLIQPIHRKPLLASPQKLEPEVRRMQGAWLAPPPSPPPASNQL